MWLALAVFAVYLRTLGFGFTSLDDVHLIQENSENISHWQNAAKAFRTDVYWNSPGTYYRPILSLSFIADHALGGDKPFIYHLTNVLLHLMGCCLLYICLLNLGYGKGKSFLFSMIFAIHPSLSQAVGWIPGRNDILLSIFILISFIALLKYFDGSNRKWFMLHLAAFMAALFTKEVAIFVPLLFLLYLSIADSKYLKNALKKTVPGWVVVTLLWLIMRWHALGKSGTFTSRHFAGGIDIIIGLLSYIGKIFFPFNLSVLPLSGDINPLFGITGLVMLVLIAWLKGIEDRKKFTFGAAWFVICLLPTFIPITNSINFLEHRLYLPMLGVIIMLAECRFITKMPLKNISITTASIIVIFTLLNVRHTGSFYNGVTFWSNAAKTSPHSGLGHQMQGRMYFKSGLIDKAQQEYMLSLAIEDNASVHNDLALLLLQKGDLAGAEKEFEIVLKFDMEFADIHNNLALVFFRQGRLNDAKSELLKSISFDPGSSEPLANLGVLYLQAGMTDSSEIFLQRSLKIDDKNVVANHHMGIILAQNKKYKEALIYITKAFEYSPRDPAILLHLTQLYLIMGNRERAGDFYQKALDSGYPRNDLLEKSLTEGRQ